MKKAINGRQYDTETAKLIAEYTSEYGMSDERGYQEKLYQKRTGEYFLACRGNAMSKYALYYAELIKPGERIIPLSVEEARKWAETCMDEAAYEKNFGKIAKDDSKKIVSMSLTREAIQLLARMARDTGKSRSSIVDELIKKANPQ